MNQQRGALSLQALLMGTVALAVIGSFAFIAILIRGKVRESLVHELVDQARTVGLQAESVRDYMSETRSSGLYDQERLKSDVSALIQTVPIVASFKTAGMRAKEAGFEFRVPKEFPRNPKNAPDEKELPILRDLQKRAGEAGTPEHWFEDTQKNSIRYFRAIRLSAECMACHGDPAQSKALWGRADGTDPTGVKMEGWKVGEVHGAYEVIADLKDTDAVLGSLSTWIATGSLVGCGLSIGLIFWLLRTRVFTRLEVAKLQMQQVSGGDLTARVEDPRQDELQEIFGTFNGMAERLRGLVVQIQESSASIVGASGEISAGNSDLSRRTEQQAASLEETASSMEEFTATTNQTAQNAMTANQSATRTRAVATEGAERVNQLVSSMGDINHSANRIAEIIGVVDEIAFQTNLLALNAAVEAARAGEQGRGFAVVAAEVRNLAKRSADAAKEIKGLIRDSVTKASDGATIAANAGKTMQEVVENVGKVTELIQEISSAAQEQSRGIQEINRAITQMDTVTQQNAALVEEAAAAAESLNDQAETLGELVGQFNTGAATSGRMPRSGQRPAPARTVARTVRPARAMSAAPALPRSGQRQETLALKPPVSTPGADGEDGWEEF